MGRTLITSAAFLHMASLKRKCTAQDNFTHDINALGNDSKIFTDSTILTCWQRECMSINFVDMHCLHSVSTQIHQTNGHLAMLLVATQKRIRTAGLLLLAHVAM